MLDQAFDALKTYDWGTDRNLVKPIEDATVTTRGDAAAQRDLETRLAAVLPTGVSRDAKDFVCRQLMLIGTAASVPTLAALLPDKDLSHMSRYALERIPAPEAAAALRAALPQVSGNLKIGVIGSLGVRRDAASIPALAALVADADLSVARAAANALGDMRSSEAALALLQTKPADPKVQMAVQDARLACAESLLAANNKSEAKAIYKSLTGEENPKFIRLAATRGMLACAAKKVSV